MAIANPHGSYEYIEASFRLKQRSQKERGRGYPVFAPKHERKLQGKSRPGLSAIFFSKMISKIRIKSKTVRIRKYGQLNSSLDEAILILCQYQFFSEANSSLH